MLKKNQPTLYANIEALFAKHIEEHPADPETTDDTNPAFAETLEKNRNRYEHRRCWEFENIATVIDPEGQWPGLKQCAVIQRDRLIGNKQTSEIHFYISSRPMTASSVLESVRNHWSIENGQHRTLDVSFGEDDSKIHERTATKNVATMRRCNFNAHRLSTRYEKESMRRKARLAAMDEEYRTELILERTFFPG